MCGINFILDKTGGLPAGLVGKMNESIKHRGMDNTSSREFRSGNNIVYLGSNRLRIIDRDPASDQPMVSADGEKAIVFSGEIYNHKDLRSILEKTGIRFRTASDTETLLYYLAEYGARGLNDLKGMFSIVFFDADKDRILAARDRHGMKPLFYSNKPDSLILSSETRGILSTEIVNRELSPEAINDYLKYRYIRHPGTIYRNIFQVNPGYYISFDLNNHSLSSECFIEIKPVELNKNEDEIVQTIEDKIAVSLGNHLETVKPAGLMFSGGVDSTLLLAIAREKDLKLSHTFSVLNHPGEKSFGTDDFSYIEWIRKKFKLENHHEIIAGKQILHELPQFIRELDMPVGDPAFITTALLARKAAGKAGVLLSGAGADEYFGGYNRHEAFEKYLKYRFPFRLARALNPFLKYLLLTGMPHPFRKKFRLIKKLIDGIDNDPVVTYDNFMSSTGMWQGTEMPDRKMKEDNKQSINELMKDAFTRDRQEYLVDDILLMSDQVSLYNGIEMRSPYLDNDLAGYMDATDPFLILKHGRKWILKRLLQKYGLQNIARRSKEGFGLPFGLWIKEQEFQYLRNDLTDIKNPLFEFADIDQVSKIVKLHITNREDHSSTLFSLLTLSEWLKSN